MKRLVLAFAALCILAPVAASAQEADFLRSLEGRWTGTGTAKLKADSRPIKLKCTFDSSASASSLSMKGRCTGLVVVSRAVEADLRAKGTNYSGVYVGPAGGRSSLSGKRSGNSIDLAVRWAQEVNGDRAASMSVTKVGTNGLRLTTTDKDPKTGKTVVTSDVSLKRS